MKTKTTKNLIEQALRTLPGDYSLRMVRSHIVKAWDELIKVENKRNKRKDEKVTPLQQWKYDMEIGKLVNPVVADKHI